MKKITVFCLALLMTVSLFNSLNLNLRTEAKEQISGDYQYEVIDETKKTCKILKYTGPGKDIVLPSKLDGYTVTELYFDAFQNIRELNSVHIPASITTIKDYVFLQGYKLTSITVDSANPEFTSKDGVLFNKDKRILIKYPDNKKNTSYTIPNTVEIVGEGAFCSSRNLVTVTIPDSVEVIEYGAFCFNYNDIDESAVSPLKTVKMGKGVKWIAPEAFAGCTSLSSITLPDSLQKIGESAFFGCESLTKIHIPYDVDTIMTGAFADCSSLKKITVSSKNNYFTSVDGVLFTKDKKTICAYPKGKNTKSYTIPTGVETIGEVAFYDCTPLTTVTIPSTVKKIEFGAFEFVSTLNSLTLPEGLQQIPANAFYGCHDLTSVKIPESVQTIKSMAFCRCKSLKSVIIPSKDPIIEIEAFADCPDLTIYGLKDSTAEKYAKEFNIPFAEFKLETGDVNADGKITLTDAMLIINDVAKKSPLNETYKPRADIDRDGQVTLSDAMYIINFVAKKSDTVFPNK